MPSPSDPDHAAARRGYRARGERLLTTDYVVDETLTLLSARGERQRALWYGQRFFAGSLAEVHRLTDEELSAAWEVFRDFSDKEWSFTDCTSKVVMERRGLARAFAFDAHFTQFGTVAVVP